MTSSKQTAEELYLANEQLVFHVLNKKFPWGMYDEDLQQCGRIGLWQACLTFDEEQQSKFASYACPCIANAIKIEIRSRNTMGRNPKSSGYVQISLDEPSRNQFKNEESTSIQELIPGDSDVEFLDIEGFWNSLTPKEKTVFRYLVNGWYQKDIGKKMGVTGSYISQIITRLKKKFNEYI